MYPQEETMKMDILVKSWGEAISLMLFASHLENNW